MWCIGEFGDVLSQSVSDENIVDILSEKLHHISTEKHVRKYILTALAKLLVRLDQRVAGHIKDILEPYQYNVDVELQQRACEYQHLYNWDQDTRKVIFDRVPPKDIQLGKGLNEKYESSVEMEAPPIDVYILFKK